MVHLTINDISDAMKYSSKNNAGTYLLRTNFVPEVVLSPLHGLSHLSPQQPLGIFSFQCPTGNEIHQDEKKFHLRIHKAINNIYTIKII